jgi:3-dehydroquinate synthase
MSSSVVEQRADFHVRDEIELPGRQGALEGRAARSDVYPIFVTRSTPELLTRVAELVDGADVAIITDEVVDGLYGAELVGGLREAGIAPIVHAIPAGEASKSLDQAVGLWHWLAQSAIARRDAIITLGGGVIADLGGWVASGYMRGLRYVNLPTTLLAQVDGALGGKVAVNHHMAKNLLGAFYQPTGVVSNVAYLESIEERHLRAGLAEAIKKAVIASPAYWTFIETHTEAILARDLDALELLVRYASAIKTALVERDPYETDLRRPLNFGHTIGHPLETVTGYGPLLHGEAVAFGMVVESRIAANRGLLAPDAFERVVALLRACGLPTNASELPVRIDGRALLAAMDKVKLIRAGSLRWVLPAAFGDTVIADDVDERETREALRQCGVDEL